MNKDLEKRALDEAKYILETSDTIRGAARRFKVSKSTIHKDLTEKIPVLDKDLVEPLNKVFRKHNLERHINGGEATKAKYRG